MIGFCVPNIVGTIVLLAVAPTDNNKAGLVVAFYCMQCFQAVGEATESLPSGDPWTADTGQCNPSVFLMLSRNSAGQTKKSLTYAVIR
jgi:hypothetical protein